MSNWIERDLAHNWHPYTQMKECETLPPLFIEKAEGLKLYDDEGNTYYDTISSWWCNIHGHRHPRIVRAIRDQLDSLDHILFGGFTHQPAIELSEKLVSMTPRNLNRVFYGDNGSTAIEIAMKMSFQYWHNIGRLNKHKFVSLDYGFHGDTVGTMSVSGLDIFNQVFSPLFFPAFKVPTPYTYRSEEADDLSCAIAKAAILEDLLEKHHDEIAAMVIEPMVLGAGGMIMYHAEYLWRARELTRKYGVHLICDEIAVGFGRTGKMFASEHANVSPDFMCLSKGLTSGTLPISATLTTNEIYNSFLGDYSEYKTFFHGHTYTANPIACAAALGSIAVLEEENSLAHVHKITPHFQKGIKEFERYSYVGESRSLGLIGALELVKNKETKEPFEDTRKVSMTIYRIGLKHGLLLRPMGSVVYLYLPLCVTEDELSDIFARMHSVFEEVSQESFS